MRKAYEAYRQALRGAVIQGDAMVEALKLLNSKGWFKCGKREEWRKILKGEKPATAFIIAIFDHLAIDVVVSNTNPPRCILVQANDAMGKEMARIGRIERELKKKKTYYKYLSSSIYELNNEIIKLEEELNA